MRLRLDGDRFIIDTPCKINPYLEVLSRRNDGFHELDTAMIAVDLCDQLVFTRSDDRKNRLTVRANSPWICRQIGYNGDGLGDIHNNLVCQALELLADQLNPNHGLCVSLSKSIPIQAGLGGGSSDAAAALIAGQWMWTGRVDMSLASSLAAKLGSDVNFFTDGFCSGLWSARCSGRGEQVLPTCFPSQPAWLIVTPALGCETAKVFQRFGMPIGQTASNPKPWKDWLKGYQAKGELHNCLTKAALASYPDLATFYSELIDRTNGLDFALSGSGSSFIAVIDTDNSQKWSAEIATALGCFVHVGGYWRTDSIQQQLDRLEMGSHIIA